MSISKFLAAAWLYMTAVLAPAVHAQDSSAPQPLPESAGAVHVVLQTTLGNIRLALDEAGYPNLPIMGYSAKFASGF